MKKFKLNRFNIILISATFIVLLFLVISHFRTYSDIVDKGASKVEGDTVYVNDQASDYYYWMGMNYVGDINSNSVSYTESTLKKVTVNYYGYPSNNVNETGYVSLTERQNKFVYYKYYPIRNNQITFELIDNPFSDRPSNKGFNGWTSSNGTITTNSNTNVQSITVSSSVDTIDIYASWADATVIYLKGTDGDDTFDGSRPDRAVATWSKAFQLMNSRSSSRNNRELNIIVLTGNISNSINYYNNVTPNYTNINTTYTETDSFEEDVIIAYANGNNRYAIRDNNGAVAVTQLTANMEVPDTIRWIVSPVTGGYTIRNFDTNRYLTGTQNGNTISLTLSNNAYTWTYDGDIQGFYNEFTSTNTYHYYDPVTTITSGENYLITSGTNPQNVLIGAGNNTQLDPSSYDSNTEWRITNTGGNNYTIYSVTNGRYLSYSNANNQMNLALSSTAFNWTYDSTNKTFSANMTHHIETPRYVTSDVVTGNTAWLGYINADGSEATLILANGNSNITTATYDIGDNIGTTASWGITTSSQGYLRIRNGNNSRYLRYNGTLSLSTNTNNANWTYDSTNHTLSNVYYNTTYYIYRNGNSWGVTTNVNNAQAMYLISEGNNIEEYNEVMYLAYNNGWKLENTNTNASVDLLSHRSETVTDTRNYYVRYNNSNYVLEANTTGANLHFYTFYTNRTNNPTVSSTISDNSYYTSSTNSAVTITSLYNHVDYRNDATWTLTNVSNYHAQVIARNDLQLEFLSVNSTGYQAVNDSNTSTDLRTSYSSFIGNNKNTRIGRGMTPNSWSNNSNTIFSFLQGGSIDSSVGSSSNTNNAYKFVIETGRYSGLMASHIHNNHYVYYSNDYTYYNYYGSIYLTMGCDYDRATNTNTSLDIYYRIGSSNYTGLNGTGNVHDFAYLMTIKSGSIGMNYFDNNTDASRGYSGIYVGGLTVNANTQNDDISSRVLIVEGGNIANVIGGLRISESRGNNGVATRIYVKGGTVQNIVGGAGVSTTYGNRYISVTGGNIAYSISGGSNGVAATNTSDQSGRLGGDSYVHVGGTAHIGTNGSGSLYDVNYGSVMGAGNGNSTYRTSGRVNTSHVYISGDAVIEGSVFGGGNFGPVLVDSNIQIDGGDIKGNVYGGANQNGVGTVTVSETTSYNVTFEDDKPLVSGQTYLIDKINGSTRNVLTGGNNSVSNTALASGSQPSSNTNWTITSSGTGYTIRNNGNSQYLSYTTGSNPSLTMANNTTNGIWNYDTTNKTFYRDIAYTLVNTTYTYTTSSNNVTSGRNYVITNTESNTAYSLNSDRSAVQLSTSSEPNTNVWLFTSSGSGFTIRNTDTNQYLTLASNWGSYSLSTSGTSRVWNWDQNNHRLSTTVSSGWGGSTTYYLRYNNGWTISTSQYSVYLATFSSTSQNLTDRFYLVFDSTWKLSTTPSSVLLSSYTSTQVGSYAISGRSDGDVTITMNGGYVEGAIYGGACDEGNIAGTVTMNINGGHIGSDSSNSGSIFGGGYGEDTVIANGVDLNINDNSNVVIDGTIYGGSALGTIVGNIDIDSIDNSGNGTITVSGDFYCGAMGDASMSGTGTIQGSCSLTVDGGTYSGSVYGGNNASGSANGTIVVTTGGTNTTTINKVFGGGNQADSRATSVTLNVENGSDITEAYGGGNEAIVPTTQVNLHGGSADEVYGGGNQAGVTNSTNITLSGGSHGDIYGGSNQSGNIPISHITTTGGSADAIYGGNNHGGVTTTSDISIEGGIIDEVYGGGNEATTGTTSIVLKGGTVVDTYGGGNQAGVTTSTTISLEGSTCTTIYGGSNTSGNVPESNITATSGSATTIYGGNNSGGRTEETNVTISNINVGSVYGGGCSADTDTTNVTINSGTIGSVYGGGESASVDTETNVTVEGGNITNLFGGSNTSGTVTESIIDVNAGTIGTIYGGNNAGGTTTTTGVNVDGGTITNIYGGGNAANSTTTNVTLNNSTNQITYIFGGCKEASATTTNVELNGGSATSVFGGSNTSGNITTSHVTVNAGTFTNVYGGNNDGGKTATTDVKILGGTCTNVLGGGNNAQTDNTSVIIDNSTVSGDVYGGGNNAAVNYDTEVLVRNSGAVTGDVYGGGNNGAVLGDTLVTINTSGDVTGAVFGGGKGTLADVSGDTDVLIDSAIVRTNVFGGGNNGEVIGSTNVRIKNATVLSSAYAGGNGVSAVVHKDTCITVEGTSIVNHHVFGGGNAAETGLSANNDSLGIVNITGATIGGNVYGGANTSVLYGETVVNIGYDAVSTYMVDNNYVRGNVIIAGTVFGGGEANASGSETYDFDFISVTVGIIINIDGHNHSTLSIGGSIFGSGNASSTTGYSRVYISNYGSEGNIKNNISLQRADLVVLNNAHMALSGTTDRTNEYSQVVFSLSRVTELDMKNNSELYLESGANLLNRFKSLDNNGNKASVTINETTHAISKTSNNRLYMLEDKVLNIALNQNVTAYGEVDGMAFFGMFNRDRNGNIVRAMYDYNYETGDEPDDEDFYYFSSGSYVLGLHEDSHNIKVDGFYTNYQDPNNPEKILVDYIQPTPDDAEHYMWVIGANVQSYDIELTASKYSTLGTYEFPFVNNVSGNTTFYIKSFNYNDLDPNVSIITPDFIPRIASTGSDADTTMGLAIKPGIGWVTIGDTYFLTDANPRIRGANRYKTENSSVTPSLVFYLYHSKNIATEGTSGTVVVTMEIHTPIDDLTSSVEIVNFNITITRAIFATDDYEGAMTPGRQYQMFSSSKMDITSKSSFSAYYSLYMEGTQNNYRTGYHRVLTSNVILPVNTKITMIDFASSSRPEYYYYIVNATDNAVFGADYNTTGEIEYPLSSFMRMGSLDTTNKYDDAVANSIYWDTTNQRAIEEFIFIVDFKDTTINNNMLDCSLLIDMKDNGGNYVHSVLGIQRDDLVYNVYANQQSAITVNANVSKELLYVGDIEDLRVTINFNQGDNNNNANRIVDTTYYEQKLGLKISFIDPLGVQVNGVDLIGTSFTLDGVTYYPRWDGTLRIKMADRVANAYANIKINTQDSALISGIYTIRVEAFYSTDGIYFGPTANSTTTVNFRLMNELYGLNATIPYNEVVFNRVGGKNINGNNNLSVTLDYSGALIEPNIKVALYRRSYADEYSMDYTSVDLADYITDELEEYETHIYDLLDTVSSTNTYTFTTASLLVTGTYKLEFRLYDGTSYVGNVIKYIIIK